VRPRPPPRRALRNDASDDRDAFRRVAIGQVSPAAEPRWPSGRKRRAAAHTVLTSEPPSNRVSESCGELLGQRRVADLPCGSSCSATRDASDRLLPSHVFVRAPTPRWFPMRRILAYARCGQSPGSQQCDSLWRAIRALLMPIVTGVVFPSRCVVAEPLTSLSPLPRCPSRSRAVSHRESRRGRLPRASCERSTRNNDPRCLPSGKDLCPATTFRASGSGLPQRHGFAAAMPVFVAFSPSRIFSDPCGLGSRARAPLPLGIALLRAFGVACRLLQPETTRGHTRRASNPHTRAGLLLRCSPAPTDAGCVGLPVRCRIGGLRATTCSRRLDARRVPLAWTGQVMGRSAREKATRVLERYRACPPRGAPGTRVTGSTGGEAWSSSPLVAPAEIHFGCRPAKGDTVGRIEVPYSAPEPLRDRRIAPPCAPGPRLHHAASAEALLWSSHAFFTAARSACP